MSGWERWGKLRARAKPAGEKSLGESFPSGRPRVQALERSFALGTYAACVAR